MLRKIFILFIFIFGRIVAQPDCTCASLLHHVDLKASEEDGISFSQEEVNFLWNKLENELEDPKQLTKLENSKLLYLNGEYNKASLNLKSIWLELNEFEILSPKKSKYTNDFKNNPFISSKMRKKMKPFLLPAKHQMKGAMDAIFTTQRATQDLASLAHAGFFTLFSQPRSFIKVVSHPLLPGYLLKLYLDTELRRKHHKEGWEWFVCRCEGVKQIHKVLKKKKIKHFKAPNKWIYPLPVNPSPPESSLYKRKISVLLVEDMKLVPYEKTLDAWRNSVTYQHLNELYFIISGANGSSYRADNIPYSETGHFAFIDTEYPDRAPNFSNIRPFLNNEKRAYWDNIVRAGGPKNFR